MIFSRTSLLILAVVAVMPAKAQTERSMTVDELFQLIESNSKTLQVQKTSVEFAQKGIEAARSGRLPEIGAQASVSYNGNVLVTDRDFSNIHGYSSPHLGTAFALEAQQVVYAGGAVSAGIRLAELSGEQAQVAVRLTRQQQRFLALGQFLDLLKLAHRKQVYEENIKLTEHLIDDVRERHAQGMALLSDVTRYELQLASLRLQLRQASDQEAILNHQLCNQLGLTEQTILPQTDLQVPADADTVGQEELLATAPAVEQSRLATLMAEQELRLAKSELLPKVALFAGDQLNGPYIYDLPPKDINVNSWYAGVGIKYAISSLFRQNKKVAQARLGSRRSKEALEATTEAVDNQMHSARTLYRQALVELATRQKNVELARQNYNVVSERYLGQLALITDMLDASTTKLDAELSEADARISIVYAYYRMKFIAGTL